MCRYINKPIIMLCILFPVFLTTSCDSKKLKDQVKAYQEAHNIHDIEKELSLMAEDIKYIVVDEWAVEGKENVRNLVEIDAEVNSHLILTDIKVKKNKVNCKITERNDWLKLGRIDALYCELGQFTFEEGLIKEIRLKRSQESAKELREFQTIFFKWAGENRSDEMAKIKGKKILDRDDVIMFVGMLRDWRKAIEEKGEEEEKKEEQTSELMFKASKPKVQPPTK